MTTSGPKFSFLDSGRNEIFPCAKPSPSHKKDIEKTLGTELSEKMNKFFQKTIEKGVFHTQPGKKITGDLIILDNKNGEITLSFSQKNKNRRSAQDIDIDKNHDLFKEANSILKAMKSIWGDHTHSHDVDEDDDSTTRLRNSRTQENEVSDVEETNERTSVSDKSDVENVEEDNDGLDSVYTRPAGLREERSSTSVAQAKRKTTKASKNKFASQRRIALARETGLLSASEAAKLLNDYNHNKPVAKRAVKLIEQIANADRTLDSLIPEVAEIQQPELQDLRNVLSDSAGRLEAITSNRKVIKNTIVPILTQLTQLADELRNCPSDDQEQFDGLLQRFDEILNPDNYPPEAEARKMIERLKQRVYFYAYGFCPEKQGQIKHSKNCEGEWLFTHLPGNNNPLSNDLHARALQFSVMHQLALLAPAFSINTMPAINPLFDTLSPKDKDSLLFSFAEISGKHIRNKRNIRRTLQDLQKSFFGTEKAFDLRLNSERGDAILHWINKSIFEQTGKTHRRLINDRTQLQEAYQEAVLKNQAQAQALAQAKEKEASAKQKQTALSKEVENLEAQLQQKEGEQAETQRQLEQLQRQNPLHLKKIKNLTKQLEAQRTASTQAESARAQANKKLETEKQTVAQRDETIEGLRGAKAAVENQVAKLKSQIQKNKKIRLRLESALTNTKETLARQNQQIKEVIEITDRSMAALENEIATLSKTNALQAQHIRVLIQSEQEHRSRAEDLQRQVDSLTSQLGTQTEGREQAETNLSLLREQAAQAAKEAATTVLALRKQLAQLNKTNGTQAEVIRTHLETLRKNQSLIGSLQRNIVDLQHELETQTHRAETAEQRLAQLQPQLVAAQSEKEKSATALTNTKAELGQTKEELETQNQTVLRQEDTIADLMRKVEQQETSLIEATQELSTLKESLRGLKRKREETKKQIDNLGQKIKQLTEQLRQKDLSLGQRKKALVKAKKDLEAQKKEAEQNLIPLQKEIAQLKHALNVKKEENRTQASLLKKQGDELFQAQAKIRGLEAEQAQSNQHLKSRDQTIKRQSVQLKAIENLVQAHDNLAKRHQKDVDTLTGVTEALRIELGKAEETIQTRNEAVSTSAAKVDELQRALKAKEASSKNDRYLIGHQKAALNRARALLKIQKQLTEKTTLAGKKELATLNQKKNEALLNAKTALEQLQSSEQAKEVLSKEIAERDALIQSQSHDLSQLKKQHLALKTQHKKTQEEHGNTLSQIKQIKKTLQETTQAATEESQANQQKIQELRVALQEKTSLAEAHAEQFESQKKALTSSKEIQETLSSNLEQLQIKQRKTQEALNKADANLKEKTEENFRLREEFSARLKQSETQVSELNAQIADSQKQLKQAKTEQEETVAQIEKLKKELQKKTEQITTESQAREEAASLLRKKDEELGNLNSQIETLGKDLQSKTTALQKGEELREKLERSLADLQVEKTRVAELAKIKSKELQKKIAEVEQSTTEIALKDTQIQQLSASLEEQMASVKKLTKEVYQLKAVEVSGTQRSIEAEQQRVELTKQLQQATQNAEKTNLELQARIKEISEKSQAEALEKDNIIVPLRASLKESQTKENQLQEAVKAATALLQSKATELSSLQSENSLLKKNYAESLAQQKTNLETIQSLQQAIFATSEDSTKKARTIEELQSDLRKKESGLVLLNNKVSAHADTIRSQISELQSSKEKQKNLESQLANLQSQKEAAETALKEKTEQLKAKVESAFQEASAKDAEIQKLTAARDKFQKQASDLEARIADFRKQLELAQQEKEKATTEIARLSKEAQGKNESILELRASVKDKEDQAGLLNKRISVLEQSFLEQSKQLEQIKKQHQSSQEELEKAQAKQEKTVAQIEQLEKELQEKTKQTSKESQAKDQAIASLQQKKEEIEKLKETLQSKTTASQVGEEHRKELERSLADLQAEKTRVAELAKTQSKELQEKIAKVEQSAKEKALADSTEIQQLRSSLQEQTDSVKKLIEQVSQLKALEASGTQRSTEAEQQRVLLNEQLKIAEQTAENTKLTLEARIKEISEEALDKDETIKTLRNSLEKNQAEKAQLQKEFDETNASLLSKTKEVSSLQSEHNTLEKQRTTLLTQQKTDQEMIQSLQQASSAASETSLKEAEIIKKLESALQEKTSQLEVLNSEVSTHLATIQSQTSKLQSSEKTQRDLESQLATLRPEKEAAEKENEQLKAKLKSASQEASANATKIRELTTARDEFEKQARNLDVRIADLQAKEKEAQQRESTQKAQIDELSKKNTQQQDRISSLESTLNDLREQLKSSKFQGTQLNDKLLQANENLGKAEKEKQELRERVLSITKESEEGAKKNKEALQRAQQEKETTVNSLKAQVQELEQGIAQSKEQQEALTARFETLQKEKNEAAILAAEKEKQLNEQISTLSDESAWQNERISSLQSSLKNQAQELQKKTKESSTRQETIDRLGRLVKDQQEQLKTLIEEQEKAEKMLRSTRTEKETATKKVIELTKEIENLKAKNDQLEKQLAELQKTNQQATVVFKEKEKVSQEKYVELAAQNINLKGKQVAFLSKSIDTVDLEARRAGLAVGSMPDDPTVGSALDRVPPAIRGGALDALAVPEDRDMVKLVTQALTELLTTHKHDKEPLRNQYILHLAIYVANYAQSSLRTGDLFLLLTKWAASHDVSRFADAEKAKLLTLQIALADKHGYHNGAIHSAVTEGREFAIIYTATHLNPAERFKFAKRILEAKETSLTPLEKHLREVIETSLNQLKPEKLIDYAPQKKNSITLIEQIIDEPKEHHLVDNHFGDSPIKAWKRVKEDREKAIDEVLQDSISYGILSERIASDSNIRSRDIDLKPSDQPIKEQWLSSLRDTVRRGSMTRETRESLRNNVRDVLLAKLSKASGLGFAKETCIDYLAQTVVATGKLPPLFHKLLCKDNSHELLIVAQLLYYYVALSTPPKQGFEEIADHESWNWLTDGHTPEVGAERLFHLMQECHRPPQFRPTSSLRWAYPITRQQATWAQRLYKHVCGGQAEPIYADPNTGKTAIAETMVRFFTTYLPECRDRPVFFLSPYHVDVQGMKTVQFHAEEQTIRIPVAKATDLHGAVIVDEGHLLHPETTITLVHETTSQECSPLQMTATPVVPKKTYRDFRTKTLAAKYAAELQQTKDTIADLDSKLVDKRRAAHLLYMQMVSGQILDKIDQCTPFMPNARNAYYPKHLAALKKTLESLKEKGGKAPLSLKKQIADMRNQLDSWQNVKKTPSYPNMSGNQIEFTNKAEKLFAEMITFLDTLDTLASPNNQASDQTLSQELQNISKASEVIAKITKLSDERAEWVRLRDVIQHKTNKWTSEEGRTRDVDAERYIELRKRKQSAFKEALHVRGGNLTPAASYGFIAEKMHSAKERHMQLIFPGVRFHADTFDAFVTGIKEEYVRTADQQPLAYPIHFVYRDSHSTDAGKGKQWVISYTQNNQRSKLPLDEWNRQPQAGTFIMLYDKTNMQGGDFGSLSFAGKPTTSTEGHEIEQFLFCNINNTDGPDASENLSENDLFQALGRRRGMSKLNSHVFSTFKEKDELLTSASTKQKQLEKLWARRTASERIAFKLLKAAALRRTTWYRTEESPNGNSLKQKVKETNKQQFAEGGALLSHQMRDVLDVMERDKIDTLSTATTHPALSQKNLSLLAKDGPLFLKDNEIVKRLHDEHFGEQVWHAKEAVDQAEHFAEWYLTAGSK